jgi:anti-sigma factor RsiW
MREGLLQELIQRELDGELSATERADLARLLLQDPEARRLHHEYRKTDQLLREIPVAEPPPELHAAIVAGPGQSPRLAVAGRRPYDRLYRVAAAILGGLLIVGIAGLLLDDDSPRSSLQGSLGAAPQDHLSLRAEGVEASALLLRDGERMRLELVVSTTFACEVIARIDPSTTTLLGNGDDARVTAAGDQVEARLSAGRQVVSLDFSGAAPIRLQLRSGDQLLAEGRLSVGSP